VATVLDSDREQGAILAAQAADGGLPWICKASWKAEGRQFDPVPWPPTAHSGSAARGPLPASSVWWP